MDYEEIFAPVIRTDNKNDKFTVQHSCFNIMIEGRKMKIYVRTEFLHGILKEEIYIELRTNFKAIKNKLKKSIYSLKQAGRCWNEFLTKVLMKSGLKQSKEDPCLFFK